MPRRVETWIAQRLYFSKSALEHGAGAARPAIRVALAGIVIGVLVMLVTICVVVGFKQTITDKIAGFGAHIQVVNYDNNNTYELQPITLNDTLLEKLRSIDNVAGVYPFITKPGIIKTDDAFEGIVVKGTENWDFFASNMTEGALPQKEQEVLISAETARRMMLKKGDSFLCYFVDDNVRVRKLTISGIYSTGFGEYDKQFIIAHEDAVRRLYRWSEQQVSGVEVMLKDASRLSTTADKVYFATANRLDSEGNALYTQTLMQMNPQIYAWLDLLDMNVWVIVLLMLAVSVFNIVSGLIILILNSITLIGTLKALGANNRFIRRIFVTESAMLIGKGVAWGNAIGLVLCTIQYIWHIIPLDTASYYVSYVPISFPWVWIVVMNIGVIAVSLLVLLAPSAIVTKISPATVMRFE